MPGRGNLREFFSQSPSYVTLSLSAGDEAAQTFIKLADVHVKLESKSEAASSWVEASKAYQKAGNPGEWQHADKEAVNKEPNHEVEICEAAMPCSTASHNRTGCSVTVVYCSNDSFPVLTSFVICNG